MKNRDGCHVTLKGYDCNKLVVVTKLFMKQVIRAYLVYYSKYYSYNISYFSSTLFHNV